MALTEPDLEEAKNKNKIQHFLCSYFMPKHFYRMCNTGEEKGVQSYRRSSDCVICMECYLAKRCLVCHTYCW